MEKGNDIIIKIEIYRKKYNRLPDSLTELGIIENEDTESEFNYNKRDSIKYVLWLGISAEESKFYYSDSKKWEDSYREIK